MPLVVEPFDDDPLCFGHTWTIQDEDLLAKIVASIALGLSDHAGDILAGIQSTPRPVLRDRHLDRLIAELGIPASDAARWHRDGWVFQMISWISARLVAARHGKRLLIRAPQPRKADKGFDGFIIELADPACAVVCEDKATVNARATSTGKVKPEIALIEQGDRDGELNSELSTLLLALADATRSREIINAVLWGEHLRYRVAITVSPEHDGAGGRADLFNGYDTKAPGDCNPRRGAETIAFPDLRLWMDGFCEKVVAVLNEHRTAANV
jgi:hypothetical protein